MVSLFLCSVAFCIYTYVGFPLFLHWKAARQRKGHLANSLAEKNSGTVPVSSVDVGDDGRSPSSVAVVIAVHNEMQYLPGKIESLKALDYPAEALSIVFVSDGSTDGSHEFLEEYCRTHPGWQCIHYPQAAGKPKAINVGVAAVDTDFIVFMDSRQRISSNAIGALLAPMQDPSIGAVSGELSLEYNRGTEASNVGLYWRYEKWIRQNESYCYSTTGATGALYAIRREHFKVLPEDTLLDDFDTPIMLLQRGLRTVFEPNAKAFDQAEESVSGEFKRKARTLTGNYQSFLRHRWLFNPLKNPVWWQFLSHKVFRLLVPYALALAFIASAAGNSLFLTEMLWLQILFYSAGLLGLIGIKHRLVNVITVFLHLNAAAVVGAWRAVSGRTAIRWKS